MCSDCIAIICFMIMAQLWKEVLTQSGGGGGILLSLCVCVPTFSRELWQVRKPKRGYVGKDHYIMCSILTKAGVLFPRIRYFLGGFLGLLIRACGVVYDQAECVRMLLGRIESISRDRTDRRCFNSVGNVQKLQAQENTGI